MVQRRYGSANFDAFTSGSQMVGGMEQAQTTALVNRETRESIKKAQALDTLTSNRSVLLEGGFISIDDSTGNVTLNENWREMLNAVDAGTSEQLAEALMLPSVMGDYFSTAADGKAVRKKNRNVFSPTAVQSMKGPDDPFYNEDAVPTSLRNKINAAGSEEEKAKLEELADEYRNGIRTSYVTPIINEEGKPFYATIFGTDAADDEVIVLSDEEVGGFLRARVKKMNMDFAALNPEANTAQIIAQQSPLFDGVQMRGSPTAGLDPTGGIPSGSSGSFNENEVVEAIFDENVQRPTTLSLLDSLKGYYAENPIVYSPGYSKEDRAAAEEQRSTQISNIRKEVDAATPEFSTTNEVQLTNLGSLGMGKTGNSTIDKFFTAEGGAQNFFIGPLEDLPDNFSTNRDMSFGQRILGSYTGSTTQQGYKVYKISDGTNTGFGASPKGQIYWTGKYMLGGAKEDDGNTFYGSGTQANFRRSIDNLAQTGDKTTANVAASTAELTTRRRNRGATIAEEVKRRTDELPRLRPVTDPVYKTFEQAFPELEGLTGDDLDNQVKTMIEEGRFDGFQPEQIDTITTYLQEENINNIDDFVAKEKENNVAPADSYKKLYMMNLLLADRNLNMPGGKSVKEVTDDQYNTYFYGTGYDSKTYDAAVTSTFDSNTQRISAVTSRMSTNFEITKYYQEAARAASAADLQIVKDANTAFLDRVKNEITPEFTEFMKQIPAYFNSELGITDPGMPARFRAKMASNANDYVNTITDEVLGSDYGRQLYAAAKDSWNKVFPDVEFNDSVFVYYYAQPAGFTEAKEYATQMTFAKVAAALENKEFGEGAIFDGWNEYWDDVGRKDQDPSAMLNRLQNTMRVVVDKNGKPLKIVAAGARGEELEDSVFVTDFLDMNFLMPEELYLVYESLDKVNEDGSAYIPPAPPTSTSPGDPGTSPR